MEEKSQESKQAEAPRSPESFVTVCSPMETVSDDDVLSLDIFERGSKANFCLAWVHVFLDSTLVYKRQGKS
jgi:hypothetical protein